MAEKKDIFLIDTSNELLNEAIKELGESRGLGIKVAEGTAYTDMLYPERVPDSALRRDTVGYTAICLSVNKVICEDQVKFLKKNGIKLILCCSLGYYNVPVEACKAAGIRVARVPLCSPSGISMYAINLVTKLSKNLRRDWSDCSLGVLGTGFNGRQFAEDMSGHVREIICFDKNSAFPFLGGWIKKLPNGRYAKDVDELFANADIISIHEPFFPETRHLINQENIGKMKDGVLIFNTSRGDIISTNDLVEAFRSGKVGGAALDVSKGEMDKEGRGLVAFYNKECACGGMQGCRCHTSGWLHYHQSVFTEESVHELASKTIQNLESFLGMAYMEKAFLA